MKIRRIHTQVAIMSKEHKFSFDSSQHKLEYFPELNMFKIDETFVPISNIREVLVEEQLSVAKPQIVKDSQAVSADIVTNPEITEDWYMALPEDNNKKRIKARKVNKIADSKK